MLRNDICTLKRRVYEVIEGEAIHKEDITIKENVPCHFSLSVVCTADVNNIPCLISTYSVYFDSNTNLRIRKNDILQIRTLKGEEYRLIAGEAKIYKHSIQVRCSFDEVVESEHGNDN